MGLLLLAAAGTFVVGTIGGLLGVGGGTFLVPFLVILLDVPAIEAVSVATFVVIGTSIGGTSGAIRSGRANLGLALLLEPGLIAGAIVAAAVAQRTSSSVLLALFGCMLLVLAGLIFWLEHRRQLPSPDAPTGRARFFDGRIDVDDERLAYRPRHHRILAAFTLITGGASGFFGIGGGIINVPVMVLLSRVPIGAAAATSVLTMAVTGGAASALHLAHGTVPGVLTAICVLASVPGARLGARIATRLPRSVLQKAFVALAALVGAAVLLRAAGAM